MIGVVVAGVGGLILGHILWLLGISMATGSSSASTWVLVISALVVLGAFVAWRLAWQRYQRKEPVPAAFLAFLPALPVIFTVIVLGTTYL